MNIANYVKPEYTPKNTILTTILKVARYISIRAITIAATIFIGIFLTVSIANINGNLERSLGQGAAPSLPFWPHTLSLTWKALNLNLGRVTESQSSVDFQNSSIRDILLTDLSRSLLLIIPAFLLLFLLGIPLALLLFRKQGSLFDRLTTLLVPISSIPSWVLVILLIWIFSIEVHLLPPGDMLDASFTGTKVQLILNAAKHMVLPVLAIFFSLFFQCVYAWRMFLLLYSDENYLDLAKAKGLSIRVVDQRYLLRPTLPYIITSFPMMLIGIWQTTAAMEFILRWPGIGWLYINSLPRLLEQGQQVAGAANFLVGVVVLFAYILGANVFLLDILYTIVDPRIRIGDDQQTLKPSVHKQRIRFRRFSQGNTCPNPLSKLLSSRNKMDAFESARGEDKREDSRKTSFGDRIRAIRDRLTPVRSGLIEILRHPTGVIGSFIILLLVTGSVAAVTLFPWNRLGQLWMEPTPYSLNLIPKYAQPSWINWFRINKVPQTIILDSSNKTVEKTVRTDSSGNPRYSIIFKFNQISNEFPQDVALYFDAQYAKKPPFVVMTWITPDGRSYDLGGTTANPTEKYSLSDNDSIPELLVHDAGWQKWFQPASNNFPTPKFELLFAVPHVSKPIALTGTYQLKLEGYTFEPKSDLNVKLVVLGQVWGLGGTDYLGRNLLVPLLWGMPFALLIGLVGASVTSLISIVLAATGVWYGGWVDILIQRLVEANMILPVIAICVLFYFYFNVSIWVILWIIVLLNVFGSPIKTFRAALLQIKNEPYLESARAYNASDGRIIFQYLIPRILPVLLPQFVSLIPSYVFLEATLGILGISSPYPTWGSIIYSAIRHWGSWGNAFWVLEPIGLLLLTGFGFAMLGFSLEGILNPRLRNT